MKNRIKNIGFIIGLFSLLFAACEDKIDPIVEDIQFERVFSPLELTAQIRNQLTAELNWQVKDDATSYVVEISQDSLEFNSILHTVEVTPDELPVSILLEGDEQYSARVKGVSDVGVDDSKWSAIVFRTDPENIFNALEGDKLGKTEVTLSWPAGSDVTHFIISTSGADDVRRDITEAEAAAGAATITGLTFDTNYSVVMYNEPNPKQRGNIDFTTLPEGETLTPDMNLEEAINTTFATQDVFLLESGEYTAYTGKIVLNRPVKIKGLNPDDKPVVHIHFLLEDGVQDVEIADLEMAGSFTDPETSEPVILDNPFQFNTAGADFGSLRVIGCDIHDYRKALINGSSGAFTVAEVVVDNCLVTNILTDGSDGIDFRSSYLAELRLTNSTFNNMSPGRDFVRLDDSSDSFPGKVSNVLIDQCTFYGVSNTKDRIVYVRFVDNTITVTNTLFAETTAYYTNQSRTSQPECSRNNYFNAPGFYTDGYNSGGLYDLSGNYTTEDPGFVDAASGDFTVTNQNLIDFSVGDPRWRN